MKWDDRHRKEASAHEPGFDKYNEIVDDPRTGKPPSLEERAQLPGYSLN